MKLKKQEIELTLDNEEIDVIIKALKFFKPEDDDMGLSPEDTIARLNILRGLSLVTPKAQDALDYLKEQYEKKIDDVFS